ncbi:hypothetical protein [Alkalicoccus daliensis]|uniref:hypothetical protein n=1 Tax=Alkalicoccus daliensis TaxID=745820 RepID=UPI000B810002|nr:hypothetical protein [Alkalicoccus daliensis]
METSYFRRKSVPVSAVLYITIASLIYAAVAEESTPGGFERFEDPPANGRLAERVPSGKRHFGDKSIRSYTYTKKALFQQAHGPAVT